VTPTLRPMRGDSDLRHVTRSWVLSYRDSEAARAVGIAQARASLLAAYATMLDDRPTKNGPALLYYGAHEILILKLLQRSDVTLACYPEDEDLILGWRCIEGSRLHYVCVKPDYRRDGIGRCLVSDLLGRSMTLTHWTDVCDRLPIPKTWKYHPTALKEALAA